MIKDPVNKVTLKGKPSVNVRTSSDSPFGRILGSLFLSYQPLTHSQYASRMLRESICPHFHSLSKQGNNYKCNYKWHPEIVPFSPFSEHRLGSACSHRVCQPLTASPTTGCSHPASKVWELFPAGQTTVSVGTYRIQSRKINEGKHKLPTWHKQNETEPVGI